jgi:hypothetical protein
MSRLCARVSQSYCTLYTAQTPPSPVLSQHAHTLTALTVIVVAQALAVRTLQQYGQQCCGGGLCENIHSKQCTQHTVHTHLRPRRSRSQQ